MSKPIWLDDAVRMKVDENLTWNEVTALFDRYGVVYTE